MVGKSRARLSAYIALLGKIFALSMALEPPLPMLKDNTKSKSKALAPWWYSGRRYIGDIPVLLSTPR